MGAEDSQPGVAADARCLVADRDSVEARFGLGDCNADDAGGNHCVFITPNWARDPSGRVRVGALMVLADHILGELPYLSGPPETWSLTSELTVDIIGEGTRSDLMHARAVKVGSDGRSDFVQGRIERGDGTPLAVGTTRTVRVPASPTASSQSAVERTQSGLAVSPATTLEELLQLEYEFRGEELWATMAEPGLWVNEFGILHGGVVACVVEMAAARAIFAQNSTLSTGHVRTDYVRPVPAGATFTVTAHLHHVGRGAAVARVLGHGADGRLCTISTVTARRDAEHG